MLPTRMYLGRNQTTLVLFCFFSFSKITVCLLCCRSLKAVLPKMCTLFCHVQVEACCFNLVCDFDTQWYLYNVSLGKTSDRLDGAQMGFFPRTLSYSGAILILGEPVWLWRELVLKYWLLAVSCRPVATLERLAGVITSASGTCQCSRRSASPLTLILVPQSVETWSRRMVQLWERRARAETSNHSWYHAHQVDLLML